MKQLLLKRIDEINSKLSELNSIDKFSIEPDSTWESHFQYEPIKTKNDRYVYI